MERAFSNMGNRARTRRRFHRLREMLLPGTTAFVIAAGVVPARAQEQVLFPAVHNAQQAILDRIRSEQVRLDVAVWFLGDGEISQAIVAKHKAGVPVRVLGDRVGIFEADANTRKEFEYLAVNGVPIRLRYNPTWFPEIMHWKASIFVGQNIVEFGSANYTTFELAPWSSTNFKDETAMFTNDPSIVRAFLTMFDRMWADTTNFVDWPAAYKLETGANWTAPMSISRARLEPDYPTAVPGFIWSQGAELLNAMIAEIDRETQAVDLVSYRLTDSGVTDALIRRFRAGVPVRVMIEPTQYRNAGYPEYWLVGTMADRLWLAGVPVKQRTHQGLTHMKVLITSNSAMHGSSNFTRFWQRDHNYLIPAAAKPALYMAMKDRFNAMWNDHANYTAFRPLPPAAPALRFPATGASNVPTNPRLEWRRAPWALAFDVYLGLSATALDYAGRVNAIADENPPETYFFTPGVLLQPGTRYYWRVVSRTAATDVDPSLVAASEVWTFTTGAGPISGGTTPTSSCVGAPPGAGWTCVNGTWTPPVSPPPPSSPVVTAPAPSTSACTTIQPVADWVCLNGGWVPPDSPLLSAAGSTPAGTSGTGVSAPAPTLTSCTTIQPATHWVCVNGGWVPPDSPLASGATAPSPLPTGCSAPSPGPGWTCVGTVWQPTGFPSAPCGALPDPFAAIGGGVCVNGGWVPRDHPLAGGGS